MSFCAVLAGALQAGEVQHNITILYPNKELACDLWKHPGRSQESNRVPFVFEPRMQIMLHLSVSFCILVFVPDNNPIRSLEISKFQ